MKAMPTGSLWQTDGFKGVQMTQRLVVPTALDRTTRNLEKACAVA